MKKFMILAALFAAATAAMANSNTENDTTTVITTNDDAILRQWEENGEKFDNEADRYARTWDTKEAFAGNSSRPVGLERRRITGWHLFAEGGISITGDFLAGTYGVGFGYEGNLILAEMSAAWLRVKPYEKSDDQSTTNGMQWRGRLGFNLCKATSHDRVYLGPTLSFQTIKDYKIFESFTSTSVVETETEIRRITESGEGGYFVKNYNIGAGLFIMYVHHFRNSNWSIGVVGEGLVKTQLNGGDGIKCVLGGYAGARVAYNLGTGHKKAKEARKMIKF